MAYRNVDLASRSTTILSFPGGSDGKASACNAGDRGSIPGLGRSPGEGHGNPLQYCCLENPRDGGAWWAAIYGVAQSRTRLMWLSSSSRPLHMFFFILASQFPLFKTVQICLSLGNYSWLYLPQIHVLCVCILRKNMVILIRWLVKRRKKAVNMSIFTRGLKSVCAEW